jgi:hypothetical protein
MACDHAFCLNCIRSWRAVDDVDVDTVRFMLGSGSGRERGRGSRADGGRGRRAGVGSGARLQSASAAGTPPVSHPRPPPTHTLQALRTCPVCRTTTHFITPSTSWPDSPEEKEAIIATYKAKMAAIDCM